jgi:hypothetical protein
VNPDVSHLTAEDVAAFLDRRMTAGERDVAETHLADCRVCRDEVKAVHRLVRGQAKRRPLILGSTGLAAAAAIAFLMFTIARPGRELSDNRVRAVPDESPARISAVQPADGDTVPPGKPVLVWSSITGEPTYRFTLTDASGQPLWTSTTADTSLTLPPQVVLQSRRTYFWYVDALRADGRAASTGVRRFTTP